MTEEIDEKIEELQVPAARKPYTAPALVEEEVFERRVLQNCSKTNKTDCPFGDISSGP